MGTGKQAKKARHSAKKKGWRRLSKGKRKTLDLDQVQEHLKLDPEKLKRYLNADPDELPGEGEFYCVVCGRHFINAATLADHKRTKDHKKQVKKAKEVPWSQDEADKAAGMGAPSKS